MILKHAAQDAGTIPNETEQVDMYYAIISEIRAQLLDIQQCKHDKCNDNGQNSQSEFHQKTGINVWTSTEKL